MKITSEEFSELKKWNKKATGKLKNIRVGSVVSNEKGIGIVVHRIKEELHIAFPTDKETKVEFWRSTVEQNELSSVNLDVDSALWMVSWDFIVNEAVINNQYYEIVKHTCIFKEFERKIPGKKIKRTVDTSFGCYEYIRYTNNLFDFEINSTNPFIGSGDKVLYAIGKSDKYISDINGKGWIYKRKISESDINHY